jgi:hypothetical protein
VFKPFLAGAQQGANVSLPTKLIDKLPINYFINDLQTVPGFKAFPSDRIFIRQCFLDHLALLIKMGRSENVGVIGNLSIVYQSRWPLS